MWNGAKFGFNLELSDSCCLGLVHHPSGSEIGKHTLAMATGPLANSQVYYRQGMHQ